MLPLANANERDLLARRRFQETLSESEPDDDVAVVPSINSNRPKTLAELFQTREFQPVVLIIPFDQPRRRRVSSETSNRRRNVQNKERVVPHNVPRPSNSVPKRIENRRQSTSERKERIDRRKRLHLLREDSVDLRPFGQRSPPRQQREQEKEPQDSMRLSRRVPSSSPPRDIRPDVVQDREPDRPTCSSYIAPSPSEPQQEAMDPNRTYADLSELFRPPSPVPLVNGECPPKQRRQ